jgi:MFS superfamily sulfate permease-like transporter
MKIKSFEFNLRELAGSMGDFGTLIPLAIGYMVACGLNPAGFLVMMGLANIVTGLVYKLPMPIEPMKVLAVVAIAQQWSPSMVYASAFATGIVWLLFSLTGLVDWIVRLTPKPVIRGIQITLGIMLAVNAVEMIDGNWLLGVAAIVIVLTLRENRYAPAALVLMALGVGIMASQGKLQQVPPPALILPSLTGFKLNQIWQVMLLAGFAQIPLTASNAIISTSSLLKQYFPERPVAERKLALNMGIMNLVLPFLGGFPLCHGAGGLAGQYYFGARTGGTNIIEGTIEIGLGLLFASSIGILFASFPMAIVGAMMLLVGLELVKFARDLRWNSDLIYVAMTTIVALLTNMAVGFVVAVLAYHLARWYRKNHPPGGVHSQ